MDPQNSYRIDASPEAPPLIPFQLSTTASPSNPHSNATERVEWRASAGLQIFHRLWRPTPLTPGTGATLVDREVWGGALAQEKEKNLSPPLDAGAHALGGSPKMQQKGVFGITISKSRESSPSAVHTAAKVRQVRSLGCTTLDQVTLEDVLANKHLPPLRLKDFEQHLRCREYSAENLYFHFWLSSYTRRYHAWVSQSGRKQSCVSLDDVPADLRHLHRFGISTFLTRGAANEINIADDIRSDMMLQTAKTYDPVALARASQAVDGMLRASLQTFVHAAVGNAGRNRAIFGIALGSATIALVIGLGIWALFTPYGRAFRLFVSPLFWFGALCVICSLQKTCPVIYIFGDNRQFYAWELELPIVDAQHASSALRLVPRCRSLNPFAKSACKAQTARIDIESGSVNNSDRSSECSVFGINDDSLGSGLAFFPHTTFTKMQAGQTAIQQPSAPPRRGSAISVISWAPGGEALGITTKPMPIQTSPPTDDDLAWDEKLPAPGATAAASQTTALRTPGVFARLARISSPYIINENRKIILMGMLWSTLLTVAFFAGLLAIPSQ